MSALLEILLEVGTGTDQRTVLYDSIYRSQWGGRTCVPHREIRQVTFRKRSSPVQREEDVGKRLTEEYWNLEADHNGGYTEKYGGNQL